MFRELRYAARALRKAPGFTLACVLTLAVGVGATTALFTIVYGILLRPLPYPNPASLVRFTAEITHAGRPYTQNFSAVEFPEWTRRTRAFDTMAAFAGTAFGVTDESGTTNVPGAYVSPEFFRVAGEPLLRGRGIGPGDDHSAVAVISRRMWAERFGADPEVLGRAVVLDGDPYTIVGIAPDDFQLPSDKTGAWVPLGHGQDIGVPWLKNPRGGGVNFLARLRSGVTLAQARDDVRSAAELVSAALPGIGEGRRVDVVRVSDWLTDPIRPTLLILAAAVGLLLLITCANLVNLQLARQLSRTRETAVHAALGASRARLVAHAFAESALIVVVGSAAAVAVAWTVIRALLWSRPADIPRIDAIRLDLPVLLFTLVTAALVAVVVALAPVVRASACDPAELLQRTGHGRTPGRAARRFRSAVVAGEVAMSVVLLVGAVLLGNSFVHLLRTDLGVRPDHVLTAFLDLDAGQVGALPQAGAREAGRIDEILQRLAQNPQIESAAAGTSLPPSTARLRFSFRWSSEAGGPATERLFVAAPVTPALFRTLAIQLVAGRAFSDADDARATPVAILSRAAARELFGSGDAVGRQLPMKALVRDGRADGVTIVGVVSDVRYDGVQREAAPALYVPFDQYPFRVVHLFARTRGEPELAASAVRDAVNSVDRRIAVISMQTLDAAVADAVAQPRFRAFVLTVLSAIAVTLAAVGLGGLVAYSVSQRTTEIGIRMALGASASAVLRMIVAEASVLSVAGIAAGVAVAFAAVRVLGSMLYGVAPHDPVSFGVAAVALSAIALVASYVPARRAARIDPAIALRSE